ncbi:hypothetical protein [Streptosporangium sp. NPDC020145]|uniref:hypothetical protein n=1 Tax=Streptosporangium sp. NPDC020145 TaxID=3154694 RepID=UPI0034196280
MIVVVLVAVLGLRVPSVDRTAYPGFARMVSARELAETFTPTEAEVAWVRGRAQDEHQLLALVVFGDVLSTVQEAMTPAGDGGTVAPDTVASVVVAAPTVQDVAERASAHEAVSAHHGNNPCHYYQHYRSHRPALFTLAGAIELEVTTAERSVLEAVEFLLEVRGAKAAFVPRVLPLSHDP